MRGILLSFFVVLAVAVGTQQTALAQQKTDQQKTQSPNKQSTSETQEKKTSSSFFSIVFSGGIVGTMIVLLLMALSLSALSLTVEHILTIRKSNLLPAGLADEVRSSLASGKLAPAIEACDQNPSFLAFVLRSGMSEVDGGWPAVEKGLEDATAEQAARLFRKIEYLSVIGNIAPMVGLLGTVTGMIFAFQEVAETQGAARAGELASGIYQALVTTVGGLVVAIPSLAAFAIFRNRVDQLVAEATYAAQHAIGPIKRMGRKQSASNVAAASKQPSPKQSTPPPPPTGA